jgi:hypothetical protein
MGQIEHNFLLMSGLSLGFQRLGPRVARRVRIGYQTFSPYAVSLEPFHQFFEGS